MRRIVGLARDELETRERVFDGLVVKSVRRSLRAVTASVAELLTAATQLTVSETPAQPQVTVPPAALGVVTTVWSESVDAELFPYLVQTFVDAAADVYAAMPETTGVAPKITYDLAADYLSSASNRLKGVGDVVWNDVRAQLALGYAAGETIQQLATRVRDVAKISEPRALTIARTEVIPAANFGSLVQLQAAGFSDDECLKEWLATDDQRTRQAHRDADGQRVPLNQLFVVDGDHLRVPGDPAGRAENVINCRCSVAFVFDDDDEDDVDVAAFDPDQPRNRLGMWSKISGKLKYRPLSRKDMGPFARPKTAAQRRAVAEYSGGGYEDVHAGAADKTKSELLRMLKPSPRNALLYRGTTITDILGFDVSHNDFDQLRDSVGKSFTIDTLTSTTIDRKALAELEHDVILEIEAPKGTNMAYIADAALYSEEEEMLLEPGLSYRIISVDTSSQPDNASAVVRVRIESSPLVADAAFEAKHPRGRGGLFTAKSPFTILPEKLRGRSGDAPYAPGMFGRYGGAGVMMRHVGADGVARYMVVQRGGNNSAGSRWRWQLPGGARDELETAEQAAARETQEELGFTQEQLNALEPRGAHVVSLPVEGKNPWTYSSVVADAPQAFKPKIDYSELGAARWLTYDQLVEMRGRGRLIAPFAAQLEDIIAKFDGPLTASGWLVTDVVTCVTSDDAPGYYELMTAAKKGKWTAADEAKVKRDDEGKFAKKAAVPKVKNPSAAQPLHINTAVIYKKGGYQDKEVVAVNLGTAETDGIASRLVWSDNLKKFVLQARTEQGDWIAVDAYTKKAAYDKFSKETGWFKPAKTTSAVTIAPTPAPTPIKTLDEMTPKEFSAWFHDTYAIGGLSSGQSLWNALTVDEQLKIVSKANDAKNVGLPGPANIIATWAGVKPSAGTPQLGKPIKLNTVAIYKTKYADGAVVAEKDLGNNLKQRLKWRASIKKFDLEESQDGKPWMLKKSFNKGEAYTEFSKQTGWTHPVAAPTTPKLPTAADVQIGYEVDDDDEPSLLETMLSNTSPAFLANWVKGLNSAYFEGQSHDDLEKIGNKVLELLNSGHLTHTQAVNIDAQLNAAQQKKKAKSVGIPDFENDSTDDVVAWYTSLTQDQFDALTASEQAEITNEASFYDAMAPLVLGQSFSEKIDDLIAGKGDSPGTETNYALESAILMMTQSEYDALSMGEKIDLHDDGNKLSDPTGALKKKLTELNKVYVETHAPGSTSSGVDKSLISIDYDDVSGPNMMSSLTYKGVPIAWVKTLSDGSGAMVYIQEDDGSKGDFLGSVDFDENETVEDLIMNLDANGTLDLSAISGTLSSTSATPAVPASTFAPNASQWHVDVHGKIKPLNAVGVPKTGVVSFKQTTDAGMQKIQQQMKMSWTPAQEKSLARYVKPKIYQAINGILRDDKRRIKLFTDSELKKAVVDATNIQEAMAPLADSLVLHRGTGAQSFGFATLNVSTDDLKNKLAVGSIIREKGFTSTSVTNPTSVPFDYAKKPVKVIINAPEGTPAVYVSSVTSEHENQNELLLGAGTSFRVDEVRSANAADKNSYGSYVEQVVVLTVVPSNASTPLASVKPTPAVAPTTLAPAASSAVVAPTLGPIQASDLKKPIKINTTTVYKVKYQHGAVVGYRKNPDDDSLMRLVWNANTKKFVTQSRESDGDPWTEAFSYGKGETYQKFGKGAGATNWYAAPPGDSAIGSGGQFGTTSVAPKVSTSAPAPSAVSAPAPAPAKPQPKVDAATIQAMHGQVPAAIDNDAQRALFDKFKKNTTSGFVTLSTGEPKIFTALHETLESHNTAATGGALGTPKLNLLQLLKIIDQQSTNKANAIAKSKGEPGDLTNAQLYEKKLIAWLQTPAGASFATDVVHPPPPAFVNGLEYKSKFSQQVLDTLAKIKPANSIGTPDPNVKVFKTVTASEAQELQKQMLSANPWSKSSKSSMTKYTGGYYATFNPIIRDLVTQTKYTSESTALTAAQDAVNIQNGMRPLPQSIRVFRKTGASQFPGLTDSATFADIKKFEGKLFKDRAPLSTSVTKGTWSGKVHLTIDLPEGTPAAFVKSISNHKHEDEMLLALGLNYRVISVTDSGGYEIKVHLRVEA